MKRASRAALLVLAILALVFPAAGASRLDSHLQATGTGKEAPAACRALLWLHTQQLPDGGFGIGGETASAAATADAVYVLALLGEDPDGARWTVNGKSALDALAAVIPDYVTVIDPARDAKAGEAGKVARAVVLAGANPRSFAGLDLLKIIQDAYNPATGRYSPAWEYRQSMAIEALLRAGETVPAAAFTALLTAQLPDGGWSLGFSGTKSDVDTTGRILQMLAGPGGVNDPAAFQKAADYLATKQLTSGGWDTGVVPAPANANSTALAIGGLLAAGFDPQSAAYRKNGLGAIDTLLKFQEASGAFVYIREPGQEEVRVMATLDALAALVPLISGQQVCKVRYLPMILAR